MNQAAIYHGGGMGGGGGFAGASGAITGKYVYERIWIPSKIFESVSGAAPNGPGTRTLPNGVNTFSWFFTPSELDIVYHHFALPSRYWKYQISAPTDCTLRIYWYTDTTAATIIAWRAMLNYVRDTETLNFVPPAFQNLNAAAGTQYTLHVQTVANFPINNPSGSVAETEGTFYLKVGRDGVNASDTFAGESYLLGASVEFPLKFP